MKHFTKLSACLLATVLFTTGCSTFFKRTPAQVASLPKHYVVTLHGVRGNEKSYGEFHELIKTHLEKIDPGYEVIPLNLTYEIARFDYTPHLAAQEINAKLDKSILQLNPQDKISIVAYSMGGQVGVAWYFDSLNDEVHKKYPLQTANFISLDAAFWGAQEAALITNDLGTLKRTIKGVILEVNKISQDLTQQYLGSLAAKTLADVQDSINTRYLFPVIDKMTSINQIKYFYDHKLIKNYYKYDLAKVLDHFDELRTIRNSSLRDLAKISFEELQALSIASPTVTELRLGMMSHPHMNQTKWTSIATLVPCFEDDRGAQKAGCNDFQNKAFAEMNQALVKYEFGSVRRETDNAVITPSAIAQFNYAFDANPNYSEGELTPASAFRLSINPENHKTIFAETLHATVVTEDIYNRVFSALGKLGSSWSRLADDVVIVHKDKCLTPEKCDHPIYKYILDELSDCDKVNNTCDQSAYNYLVKKFQQRDANAQSVAEVQKVLRSEIHGFTLELNLRTPKGYDTSKITESNIFDFIKTNFAVNSDEDRILQAAPDAKYKIHLGRKLELGSILIDTVNYADQTHFKVNFTGQVTTANNNNADYNFEELQKGLPLKFTVALPGLKTRQVEAVISPSHSTFVDLVMAPK